MGISSLSFISIKNTTKLVKNKRLNNKGFTLVEIIIVLAIIAILASVAVPSFIGCIEKAKKEVCNTNCLQLERMYETYLILEGTDHTDVVFAQYLQEYGENICPDHGDISYVDGKVQCSIHTEEDDNDSDDKDDGSVPFL